MRKLTLIFGIIFFVSCFDVEQNCSDFKTGTYKSEIIIDSVLYTSNFTRTTKIQIEEFDGKIDSSSVRWINDCEMIFKTINQKNLNEKKDIHLKILTTTTNSYKFEYGYVGDTNKRLGEAILMN